MRVPLAALAALGLSASPAAAVTFTVNSTTDKHDQTTADSLCKASDGTCTLRAAIEQADALSGADEVDVPAGMYQIGTQLEISSALTLKGTAGSRSTVIDANGTDSPLVLDGSGPDFVSGFAVTGNNGSNPAVAVQGAADLQVTLSGMNVHNNTSSGSNGAGVRLQSGQLTLTNSAVTDNKVTSTTNAVGGGIDITGGSATVVATTVAHNTAQATGSGQSFGGGINTNGTSLALRHVTFIDNIATSANNAQFGGNLYLGSGQTNISDSIVVGGESNNGADCNGSGAPYTVTGKNIYSGGMADCAFPSGTVVATAGQLTALGDHGGPGLTAVPMFGSPAIDAASGCPDGGKDQRGTPAPSGAACDIGAVETAADLQVTLSASAPSAPPGGQVTYVAKVLNAGFDDSPSTVLTVTPPAGAAVGLVTPSAGSCSPATTCNVGTLASGQSATVTIVVSEPATGPATTTASAAGGVPDPTPADANASTTTAIAVPGTGDTTAPVITHLGALGKLISGKAGKLKATLSEAAKVKIAIARLTAGRKVKGTCRSHQRHGKRCTITKSVGTINATLAAGLGKITLPKRLGKHALAPGRYRLTATAVDAAGNRSKAVRAVVTVRRAPKKKHKRA